jgi:threonine dehydrogenase-like Zn-dependent dehydrogenase
VNAVILEKGRPEVVDRPAPLPGDGEAVIRVALAGICGTDLEIARGYLDFTGIPGHEFVGVVEQAPEPGWVGKRVVGEINVGCGACERCASAMERHCPERTVVGIMGRDGAFAERVALPLHNLHEVPSTVPTEAAVFTEPLAAAHEILDQVTPGEGDRALVLGDGRLGQLCASVLARTGCRTLVAGRHPEKLRRLGLLGIRTVESDGLEERGFDLVVEATGRPDGLRRALEVVRPRGTIVLKSTYHGEASFELAGLVIDEVSVIGSRCGRFVPALEHLTSDPTVTEGMITACFPLDRVRDAFTRAMQPDALKVLLAP